MDQSSIGLGACVIILFISIYCVYEGLTAAQTPTKGFVACQSPSGDTLFSGRAMDIEGNGSYLRFREAASDKMRVIQGAVCTITAD
jgi:hypothetical protein